MAWRGTWRRHPSFLDKIRRGMECYDELCEAGEKSIFGQLWASFLSCKRSNSVFFKIQQLMFRVQSFCPFGSIWCQLQFRHIASHFRRHLPLEDCVQDKTKWKSALELQVMVFIVKILVCLKKKKKERDFSITFKKVSATAKCWKQFW